MPNPYAKSRAKSKRNQAATRATLRQGAQAFIDGVRPPLTDRNIDYSGTTVVYI
jgi:hypothetical protein